MPNAAQAESSRPPGAHLGPQALPPSELAHLPSPGPSGESRAEVWNGLRIVRTIAMLSIVSYHVTWEPLLGIAFGLTSLQIIMCALATRGTVAVPMRTFAQRRAKRLLAPWLIWSALYALFEVTRSAAAGEPLFAWTQSSMWASGASFHLWFLPFAFVACLLVNAAHQLRSSTGPGTTTGASIAAGLAAAVAGTALLIAADPIKSLLAPAIPFDMWVDGAPTLAFGLAIGRALATPARARGPLLLGIALIALVPFAIAGTSLANLTIPHSGLFERYAIAIPVICLGLLVPIPDRPWMAALAATNLGVYLVHLFAIRILDRIPSMDILEGPARSVVVYALCLAIVFPLRKTRVPHLT